MAELRQIGVTGATGFIGGHVLAAARERGFEVIALVRSLEFEAPTGVETRLLDLSVDQEIAPEVLSGCDALIHLASHIPADHDDMREAQRCWQVNSLGCLRLLDAAAATGVKHFIQTTAANAYSSQHQPASEDSPLYPGGQACYYLSSKVCAEFYATHLAARSGMISTSIRPTSVYGPRQRVGAIAKLAAMVSRGEAIQIVNDGVFSADFVYVDDVVESIFVALDRQLDGPLNVGSGERRSIRDVVDLLIGEFNQDPEIVHNVSDSSAGTGFPAVDVSRARELGLSQTPLETGVKQVADAFR